MVETIDGIKAPAGGFKQGGWYSGRQYWGGTLSAPGVINSQSDQVGAGQAVSKEVNQATSLAAGKSADANQKYIDAQYAQTPGSGSSSVLDIGPNSGNINAYLDEYQSNQYNNTLGDLKTQLTGGLTAPATIKRADILQEQRTKYSVDETEQQLNELKTQERTLLADMRAKTVNEEGKPVALGVISGRISEEQRQTQQDLDYLNVRKATLVDELTTKYNAINTYVNYAGLDYQDAKAAYDTAFSQNLQLQQFISGEKQNAVTNARANLTTMMNAITSGNMNYNNISADEKLQIQKLEIQSGLPVGTMSRLQIAPKDKILGWSDDKTQVMMLNENGGFSVVNSGIKKSSGSAGSVTAKKQELTSNLVEAFNSPGVKWPSGYVDPEYYKKFKEVWVANGGETVDFDKQFSSIYANPEIIDQYNITGQ